MVDQHLMSSTVFLYIINVTNILEYIRNMFHLDIDCQIDSFPSKIEFSISTCNIDIFINNSFVWKCKRLHFAQKDAFSCFFVYDTDQKVDTFFHLSYENWNFVCHTLLSLESRYRDTEPWLWNSLDSQPLQRLQKILLSTDAIIPATHYPFWVFDKPSILAIR